MATSVPELVLRSKMESRMESVIADVRAIAAENESLRKRLSLSDADKKLMEHILGRNLRTAEILIDAVRKLAEVKIEPATAVVLREEVLSRLHSRCPRNEPLERYIENTVTMLLEQFVGLR